MLIRAHLTPGRAGTSAALSNRNPLGVVSSLKKNKAKRNILRHLIQTALKSNLSQPELWERLTSAKPRRVIMLAAVQRRPQKTPIT